MEDASDQEVPARQVPSIPPLAHPTVAPAVVPARKPANPIMATYPESYPGTAD